MNKVGGSDPKNTLYCSFCGKSQHEVRKLIAGPTVIQHRPVPLSTVAPIRCVRKCNRLPVIAWAARP